MSFLLPHFLEEGRGDVDVYFTRVYNPLWINPDGFMWLKSLRNEEQIKFHVALTPTWNESAYFADYVLPMGHAGERHDLMSQETHAGMWIGFRQPVRRVALERAGRPVRFTHEANPGEVWEENEFWVELTGRMDPDGSLGIRHWVESPERPGELVTQDEYWSHIFEHSVPGLPEAAKAEGLSPLEYMRKYGCFEVKKTNYVPYEAEVEEGGVEVDGVRRKGFGTPSGKLEFFTRTLHDWGWKDKEYTIPWTLESHVAPRHIDREKGEMILLPNFRLPTLIHPLGELLVATRSAMQTRSGSIPATRSALVWRRGTCCASRPGSAGSSTSAGSPRASNPASSPCPITSVGGGSRMTKASTAA